MFVYSRHPRKRTKISHLSERPSNFRSKSLLKAFSLSGTAGNRSDNSVIDSSSLSQMGHTDTPACTVWKWVMKEKIKTVRKKDSACTHSVVVLDRNNIKTLKILSTRWFLATTKQPCWVAFILLFKKWFVSFAALYFRSQGSHHNIMRHVIIYVYVYYYNDDSNLVIWH